MTIFDNRKAAAQRLGQSPGANVLLRHGRGRFGRVMMRVVVMFVIAHGSYLAGELAGMPVNKSNGGRAFVENQSRALVERLLDGVNPQQKIRQLGILLEYRQHFRGLGFAFATDAGRVSHGVVDGFRKPAGQPRI